MLPAPPVSPSVKPFSQDEWDKIQTLWPELPLKDLSLDRWYMTIKQLEFVLAAELEAKAERDKQFHDLEKSIRNLEIIIGTMLHSRPGMQERLYTKTRNKVGEEFELAMTNNPDGVSVALVKKIILASAIEA